MNPTAVIRGLVAIAARHPDVPCHRADVEESEIFAAWHLPLNFEPHLGTGVFKSSVRMTVKSVLGEYFHLPYWGSDLGKKKF